jgi:hypothetical protein
MMPKIVTANMLSTGRVVFLGKDGCWVSQIDDARLFADAEAAEEGLAIGQRDAQKALVVDPFVTDRDPANALRGGMTMRDAIRAFGPTIKYGPAAAPTEQAL